MPLVMVIMVIMIVMVVCPALVSFVGASTSNPPVLLSLPLALSVPVSFSLPRSVFRRRFGAHVICTVEAVMVFVVVLVAKVCAGRVTVRPATCYHVTVT